MAKTPVGKKATDSPFKDKRFTKHDLRGVAKKDEQARKDFDAGSEVKDRDERMPRVLAVSKQ